jgi:purine-nucleoside phosphorylase
MVGAYDPHLRQKTHDVARVLGIELHNGVYAGLAGPSFETPAEIEMLRRLGADLVGMSTVLEVIAARHLGMRCLCISLIANLAAGVAGQSVDHEEVLEVSHAASDRVARLLASLLESKALFDPGSRTSA